MRGIAKEDDNASFRFCGGDTRTGIVAGTLGAESHLENVSYENVTGATRVIGATYDKGEIIE